MNYYEHHIRDYDTATSHLSWEEDLAYTRLIRWYYRKEQPIPVDVKEACRQVRAVSKAQRDAVESVLKEFFELRDDGWHQNTCDEVIDTFQAGEPEREAKKANEENRTKRHREERAKLFKELTDAGEHAPWNIGIEALREMVKRLSNGKPVTPPVTPATEPVTPPVTAPATLVTATQTPVPRHQTPDTSKEREPGSSTEAASPEPATPTPQGLICKAIRDAGIPSANPSHPTLLALIEAGATVDEFRAAAGEAVRANKPSFAYVIGTVKGRREDAASLQLAKGRLPNKQEALEQSNASATAGWMPPELREKTA